MSAALKGFVNAIVSAASFGLIPLFTLPVLATGMHASSILIYRYAFGCLAMLLILMVNRSRMSLGFGDFLRTLLLSVFLIVFFRKTRDKG